MSGIDITLLHELRNAVAFLDKVRGASEDERIAVGQDHWVRLEAAARAVVDAYYPKEKPVVLTAGERSLLRAALQSYYFNGMLPLWIDAVKARYPGLNADDFVDNLNKKIDPRS